MRTINLSKILAKYKKGWIALTPDNRKFLTSGKTLQQVLETAHRRGVAHPSVFKAIPAENFSVG